MIRLAKFPIGLERYSGVYIWIVFVFVFSLWVPQYFLTMVTLHSIAAFQVVPAIVAVAILVPLTSGTFDLSVGSLTNLVAVCVVILQTNEHLGMWPSIIISLALGLGAGVVNGLLVVVAHIDSFIATLGTSVVFTALIGVISNESQPVQVTSASWLALTQHKVFGFEIVIVYLVVVALAVWWFLDHTPAGRYMYAIGGNAEAARLSGVKTGKWQFVGLTISGTLCGLAGVIYSSVSGPSLTFGAGLLLPGFAAVFLGTTQIRPGRANIWGTLLAVYLLATGVYGLQLVTGVQWLNDMFSGVVLLLAVGFAVWRQRHAVNVSRRRIALGKRPPSARRPIQSLDVEPGGDPSAATADSGPEQPSTSVSALDSNHA